MRQTKLQRLFDLMYIDGARMVKMFCADNPDRVAYYILPPGVRISKEAAEHIKKHPKVTSGKDGLFPGHEQTWRMQTQ